MGAWEGVRSFFFEFKRTELGVFFSHCYFGGCGHRFSSLAGKVWMGCCVASVSYRETEPGLSIGGYCGLCECFLSVMI